MVDSNVEAARQKLLIRSQRGFLKYGTTTDRTDLTYLQWLNHAQEEAMDFVVYLQKLIAIEEEKCRKKLN